MKVFCREISRSVVLGPQDLQRATEFPCMVGTKTAVGRAAPRTSNGNYCAECKCENAWQRRFCRMCGSGLTKACAACQFSNGMLDQFCGGCGGETGVEVQVPNPAQVAARPRQELPRVVANKAAKGPPTTSTTLANRLTNLNVEKVQKRQVTPPPPPGAKPEKNEIGQEQIDALFG